MRALRVSRTRISDPVLDPDPQIGPETQRRKSSIEEKRNSTSLFVKCLTQEAGYLKSKTGCPIFL